MFNWVLEKAEEPEIKLPKSPGSSKIKRVSEKGCILSPYLFNLYTEYIMRNAGLEEAQAESRLPGEISTTSDMQMTPPTWLKAKKI